MNTFFITGGLGFVGSHLVQHLLERHPACRIVVFDSEVYPNRRALLPTTDRLTFIRGDVRDQAALNAALAAEKPEALVHLAAVHYIPYCMEHQDETRAVNITGTANILNGIKETPSCRFFAIASSAAVYKDQEKNFCETDPLAAIDIYGETKIACEKMLNDLLPQHIACRVLRFFNVFGAHDPVPHVIPEILKQLVAGTPLKLGLTENYRDFIHATDIATAIAASLDPVLGPYCVLNVGTGRQVSVQEIIRTFSALIKKRYPAFELQTAPMDSQRVRPTDRKTLCADISKITQLTAWRPQVTLEDGLDRLLESEGVYTAVAARLQASARASL